MQEAFLYQWLFLDLNSYFASVEQQLNPKLRGKPVGIVPSMALTTSCIAASYEAKKFGVKTGTRLSEAKKLCPNIQFVEARHEEYIKFHHAIINAVDSVLPVTAVLSIDEMACKLMGSEQTEMRARELALQVKNKIKEKVGEYLTCSVGLAPNRFLAKVATDMQKPDGLVCIRKQDLPHVLYKLKLRDFPGIGENMEKRLNLFGIQTTEKLLSLTKEEVRHVWNGINGEHFYAWIHGEDTDPTPTKKHSISHSHVLPPDFRTNEKAFLIAMKLLHKAAARLRKNHFWASSMSLHINFVGYEESYSQNTNMTECCDDITMTEHLKCLWEESPKSMHPMKVSIALYNLIPDELHNLSFFDHPRRAQLASALDEINSKFGKNTATFASMKDMQKAAPTRIAFTNIPDEIE